jgi:Tol biopolymer transport system component
MKRLLTTALAVMSLWLTAEAQHPQPVYSYLEIYDVPSRTHKVIKTFPYVIEAPNWTPDGQWLVINKGGRLYKTAPDGSTDLIEIPTGAITQCNNDHVITADGKWIGLSSNDPANTNSYNSYVYVVPFEGGEPRRITPEGPSYLHGISPDGKMAAYCAFRGPKMEQDVYVMPLKGGKEIRLTDAPGLDDGPEYSPDGKQIWFNSVRTGRMQVWRMQANGKKQTQMTFDQDMNSWFPHISPDGKTVVYIAYHDYEIDPGSHVANLNVQLRMIPARGATPEVLTELFGGQGTINVNSWSPDSKQFAYVSYRLTEEMEAPAREMAVRLSDVKPLLTSSSSCAYVFQRLAQMGYTAVDVSGDESLSAQVEAAGLKVLASPSRQDGSVHTADGNTFITYPQEGSVLVALEHPASANLLQALRKIALYLRNATD